MDLVREEIISFNKNNGAEYGCDYEPKYYDRVLKKYIFLKINYSFGCNTVTSFEDKKFLKNIIFKFYKNYDILFVPNISYEIKNLKQK